MQQIYAMVVKYRIKFRRMSTLYSVDSTLPGNVYIVPICIITGAFSMFSVGGCVSDIYPWECIAKYCHKGSISQYTPQGAGSVLENMISVVQ